METLNQSQRSQQFRSLHTNPPLVLPCVWDAGSARLMEASGANAIATASGAIAWSCGFADGESMPWTMMLDRLREISRAISVPVTADIEHGYAHSPAELKANIEMLIDAGYVGINIEDAYGGALVTTEDMINRIRLIREVADRTLPGFFVNLRTDCFLLNGANRDSEDASIERAVAYAEAGADGFFCPGLVAESQIRSIADATELPLNVMWNPALPNLEMLAELGVRRLSLGTTLAEISFNATRTNWREISGAHDLQREIVDYQQLNSIMAR